MIYTKQNLVYYLTSQPVNDLTYDLYNFSMMTHSDNAYKDLLEVTFRNMSLERQLTENDQEYLLELDFLANQNNDRLASIIEKINLYFSSKGFHAENNADPLYVRVDKIAIDDVMAIIRDSEFQTINNIVGQANCSIWKLHKR